MSSEPSQKNARDRNLLTGQTITRRAVLGRVVALPLVAALPAALAGCSKGPHCEDTGGLSADDLRTRTEIAAYTEQTQDPSKHCRDCVQFNPGGQDACGTCKVVKGPINPNGSCKLFVKKT
jgi:hypothetical protein